jgi:hypothetical protein
MRLAVHRSNEPKGPGRPMTLASILHVDVLRDLHGTVHVTYQPVEATDIGSGDALRALADRMHDPIPQLEYPC